MNPWIQLQKATPQFLITLLIVCLGSSQKSGAVTPAPDGGYPGGNTAEGEKALLRLSSGGYNTAIGWLSIESSMTGTANTGVGAGTLALNTADGNTAAGAGALLFNKVAIHNTAAGAFALFNNNSTGNAQPNGCWNSAFGEEALFNNTDGAQNAAFGESAMHENTTGNFNTGIGDNALRLNQTGSANTAVGYFALSQNTAGDNTATGYGALSANTTGRSNTANGAFALFHNADTRNNAFGFQALITHTSGPFNNAFGALALSSDQTGSGNNAFGDEALGSVTTGSANTAIGDSAGFNQTVGNGNVYIGAGVPGVAGEFNNTYIANINTTQVSGGNADFVTVDLTSGLLGHQSSSRRYKEDIKPMDNASETLYRLKPVTYRYKKRIDRTQSPAFGFVAEDVAEVNPDLVARNGKGQPEGVHYEMINAMLLNEFLKEHKAVQEQGATITELKKQIQALTAGVQKVSAQLEVSKSAP